MLRTSWQLTIGLSSTSSSPLKYCFSNTAFSPTYDEIMRLICTAKTQDQRGDHEGVNTTACG